MIQLTQEALLALIHDASTRAAAQAMAQFVAQHPINPPPPSPRRSRDYPRLPRREQRQEEVNSRVSRPEVAQTQEQYPPQSRGPTAPLPSRGVEDPYLALAIAPPRRSPFSTAILAEALPGRQSLSHHPLQTRLAWFNQLPAGTISSLEQLTQRFLHHFSMNKRVPKTAAFLFTIRQRENEPLRDYMQRFIEAVHEVPHINHELLASIIQQNLLSGRFKESIAGKPPSTMEDLLMRSQKYIRIEESNSSDPSSGVKRKGREEEKSRERKKNANIRGHTTEECHHLKNEIEKLIQRGHLRQYVNREQSRQPQETASNQHPNRQPPHSRGYRRDFGRASRRGFRQCKESPGSRSQEKQLANAQSIHNINSCKQGEIAFGEQDLDPMRNQNNDALVISATLSNFWVKKVLVDSGSSADIIFYDAYVQLGVDNAQLRKAPSAYNIILGRPSLNLFRAIASTFHMKLKFPTSDGVGKPWEMKEWRENVTRIP
ncbi:UNVERIFIED_CONTAM: hypothetical protein Sangu_0177400 [Sesamum angustifolium]|uniref:Retrotransposon gag domain-containing protein n=1 Tax=Sesamum angustifolium TaxID=2727405 RepID=A0AAW2RNT0_9LAMI